MRTIAIKLERADQKIRQEGIAKQRGNPLPKPAWLRRRAVGSSPESLRIGGIISEYKLQTICHQAFCPNRGDCMADGTAAFLIMGSVCTRRCAFCDVAHGTPEPLDPEEPRRLAQAVAAAGLSYAVVTSVDRDDLKDGGAGHFSACVKEIRKASPEAKVEILVPDFRGRDELALGILSQEPADVFNHNIETVPRLYKTARRGGDYQHSLRLLRRYKELAPSAKVKSGLMLGLGETDEEVERTLLDLRGHGVDIVTVGQYLPPSPGHLRVERYVSPEDFGRWKEKALEMGFSSAFCGVFVRSSYHAQQAWASASKEGGGAVT